MPNVTGAYCALTDLRLGDIPLPTVTTKDQYITGAAQEIDAALGHLYVTPLDLDEADPAQRPAALFIRKLNWLLASSRAIFDVAIAGEADNLHALARQYFNEVSAMIEQLLTGKYVMVGAPLLADASSTDGTAPPTGPMIFNEDPNSLLEEFYRNNRPTWPFLPRVPVLYPPIVPYDTDEVSSA
jgi:hypothetical protein